MDILSTVLVFIGVFLLINVVSSVIGNITQQRQGAAPRAPDLRQVVSGLAPMLDQPLGYLGVLPRVEDEKKRELLLSALASKSQEHLGEALRSLYQCLALANDPSERAAVSLLIANCLYEEGSFAEAENYYNDAIAHADDAGDRRLRAVALGNLALLRWRQGDPEQARRDLESAVNLDRMRGYEDGLVVHLGNLSRILQAQGDRNRAESHGRQAAEAYMNLRHGRHRASALANLGLAYKAQGRLEEALSHTRDALQLNHDSGFWEGEAAALANLGLIYQEMGDQVEARTHLEEAHFLFHGLGATDSTQSIVNHIRNLS